MKGFKKCSNGHWYKEELTTCPYCPGGSVPIRDTNQKGKGDDLPTEYLGQDNKTGNEKSTVIINTSESQSTTQKPSQNITISNPANRTVFLDEVETKTADGNVKVESEYRVNRRLVGWLVTYSLDPLGVDFKIYEGKNLIGRDINCNITINDKMVSGKHATLLFRADKYRIKDELSAHGTFVNSEDIETEAYELQDGDIIKVGETFLKFKSSL